MGFEKTVPLNEFITLQRGFDLPKGDRVDGNIPVVASTGIGGYHNEAKVEAPGVVIGRSGSIGGGQYITEDFWPLNTTLWVKDFKGHHPRYVYYLLRSIDFQQFNVGSGVPTLNRNHLSSVLVADIGFDNEKRLAEIIGELDDKIELNRQTNQTLEQIAQAIFKSWFVDFEPTRAKAQVRASVAQGRMPGSDQNLPPNFSKEDEERLVERAAMAAISGKPVETLETLQQTNPEQYEQLKTTATLFPDALVDSELGEIPEGWGVVPLADWGEIVCGKTPSKKEQEYYGGGIPFIKIPDMHGNMFAVETVDSLSEKGAATQKKKKLPKGSVCVSCIATVGQVLITTEESFTNQQINSIVPNRKTSTPYLYFSMLGLYSLLHDLASGGSATLNLNTGNFSKIEIMEPEEKILEAFSNAVEPSMNQILENIHQQRTLSELRDILLPKLLSGELTL